MGSKIGEADVVKLIAEAQSVQGHGEQVARFIQETRREKQSGVLNRGRIPYVDLEYDTLYLAANSRGSCYYIYVPTTYSESIVLMPEKIGMYWRSIVLARSKMRNDSQGVIIEIKRLNWEKFPLEQESWVRKLEVVNELRSHFLNWNQEPWGNEK